MDVLDFPTNRRRSSGSTVAGPDTAIIDFDPRARTTCMHERLGIGGLTLDVCPDSNEGHWLSPAGATIEAVEALARLFGAFDLRAALPGIDAPGARVLVYSPDTRRGRQAMLSLPAKRWIEAASGLWLTHDGEYLLMSPEDPLLAENLARDLISS